METAMIQATEFEAPQTTDPREAKLKDIIEKGKASLHKAIEEIQHEFAIREDMAVRPTAIDFLVHDHKIQPVIRVEAYDLTDHSQGQMLTRYMAYQKEKAVSFNKDGLFEIWLPGQDFFDELRINR